jgi:hypothetical protein
MMARRLRETDAQHRPAKTSRLWPGGNSEPAPKKENARPKAREVGG